MIPKKPIQKLSSAGMPFMWQTYAYTLMVLAISLLFISHPIYKYSIDILISVLSIGAMTWGFILREKNVSPWGYLFIAVICVHLALTSHSLIFFGFAVSPDIAFWLEQVGIVFSAVFVWGLVYTIEKKYDLKGITLDFILITLSLICAVFFISENLISTVLTQLNKYEVTLVFNFLTGCTFIFLFPFNIILTKKIALKEIILSTMTLFLVSHFFIDAYQAFSLTQDESKLLTRLSWLFYQLSLILAIFIIFLEKFEFDFTLSKTKVIREKLLWIATITGTLIVPFGVTYRWVFKLSAINTHIVSAISSLFIGIVVWRVIIIIRNYESQRQRLNDISFTDDLTGASNYLGLHSHLSSLENAFVLNVNIEDFKSINDMYDRKFGDQVLISLANRISQASGVLHTARTTGDNFFAVFQCKEKDIHDVFLSFEKEIGVWDTVSNRRVAVPLTYGGSHNVTPEKIDKLIRSAEIALKQSRLTKTQFTLNRDLDVSDSDATKIDIPRHELREILQNAIDTNHLPIHFQPIYDIESGNLKALEMLIRVYTGKYGLLMPFQFLEQAKSYGLLTDLTRTCVKQLAKQIHRLPMVTINLNIPPYMLNDEETLFSFIHDFKQQGLPAERFCIEVTEDGDIPTENLIPAINKLKKAGFTIAMDDFGTGYSSLGRLSTLPFDTVKIDRSLLVAADNGDKTILESAISLVKRLGATVVVEGVETIEQLALIKSLGADSAQGFLLSKPISVTTHDQFYMNASDIVKDF